MEEPEFKLQLFCKALPDFEWKCFNFSAPTAVPVDIDPPLDGDGLAEDVDSSSSSASSSSSSSSSNAAVRPTPAPEIVADEITGALHRSMWHVALDSRDGTLDMVRTACGRRFPRASISTISDLLLEPGQSLCSHAGCRKGWRAVGAV